ncbi:MAG: hypothetical protein WCF85_18595 [Rhodospirillaceae bacterium]
MWRFEADNVPMMTDRRRAVYTVKVAMPEEIRLDKTITELDAHNLVEHIYDAAVDPKKWSDFLGVLSNKFRGKSSLFYKVPNLLMLTFLRLPGFVMNS